LGLTVFLIVLSFLRFGLYLFPEWY